MKIQKLFPTEFHWAFSMSIPCNRLVCNLVKLIKAGRRKLHLEIWKLCSLFYISTKYQCSIKGYRKQNYKENLWVCVREGGRKCHQENLHSSDSSPNTVYVGF